MLSGRQIKRPPLGAAFLFVWRREGELIESALTPSSFRETQTGRESCVVTHESNVLHPARAPAGVGKFLSPFEGRSAKIRRKQVAVSAKFHRGNNAQRFSD